MRRKPEPPRRYRVIFVDAFGLQSALRLAPEPEDSPAVLLDRRRGCVIEVDPVARARGIEPGFTASQAQARIPEVIFKVRSPAAEASSMGLLLRCAFDLSPYVEATREGVVTLRLTGHYGDNEMAGALDRLRGHGLKARVGGGADPVVALLAAAATTDRIHVVEERDPFLEDLPIGLLGLLLRPGEERSGESLEQMIALLGRWGVKTIGAFLRLPPGGIVERLGALAGSFRHRLAGGVPVLRPVLPDPQYEEGLDFEREIECLEPLLFVLKRFLDELLARLGENGRVVGGLELALRFADDTSQSRRFEVPSPTGDAGGLFRMLQTGLENVRTESPIAAAVLRAIPAMPPGEQFQLFESTLKDPNRFRETLARLGALLGEGRVGEPEVAASHRPDAVVAARVEEVQTPELCRVSPAGPVLRRFRPARVVEVRAWDGVPVSLGHDGGDVVEVAGPWDLSGEWWEEGGWARREWDVRVHDGALYRLAEICGQWFLEGMYD